MEGRPNGEGVADPGPVDAARSNNRPAPVTATAHIMHQNRTASADFENGQYNQPPPPISHNATAPDDSRDRIDSAPPGHHRVRSWSGQHPFPQVHPSYGAYSPSGVPYVPVVVGQTGAPLPFPPQTQYNGSRRKRKAGSHRRAQSYDHMPHSTIAVDQPPPLPSGRSKGDFSPRSEIMKLTGSFRSSSPVVPSPTNSMRKVPLSPQGSAHGQGYSTLPPHGPSLLRRNTETAAGRVYGTNGDPAILSYGGTPFLTGSSRLGTGGEAVFAAQKKDKHRRSSSRKMHMRQKSAQLFMEDVKGVEQIPSCRDIIFLMLFVFHLLGIVYLGNTYGYEALRYHDDVDTDYSVTIVYQNLVYVCLLSGVFAIIISTLTLILMMAVAKKIVQIALIMTITLSFAWGTIGIGLSPRKVVPATGIIALALSVAYAIVVWDRCKFHGANLYASLTGIRANPGAVIIAFVVQFLSLVWSLYFFFVAVGVYDAVETGDIQLPSHTAKILIYCALGVSYYWTLQVFLVRSPLVIMICIFVLSLIHAWSCRMLYKSLLLVSLVAGGSSQTEQYKRVVGICTEQSFVPPFIPSVPFVTEAC